MTNWTKEKPTKPGFYWLRNYRIKWRTKDVQPKAIMTRLTGEWVRFFNEAPSHLSAIVEGEWSGPIEPPSD